MISTKRNEDDSTTIDDKHSVTQDCSYDDTVDTDNGGDNEWEGAWTHSTMTLMMDRSSSTAISEPSSSSSSNNTSTNLITMAEVRIHNTDDDLWMVLENKVYDLTEYAPTHPGGPGYLTMNAGLDGTDPFTGFHVSVDARPEVKEYYIGDLDMSSLNEWVFEMSRPLKTASTKTDAQFVEGQSVDFGLSFWVSFVFSTRSLSYLSQVT